MKNQHTTSLQCCQKLLVFHDGTTHSGCNIGYQKHSIPVHPTRDPPRLYDFLPYYQKIHFHSRSLLQQKKVLQIDQLDQVLHKDNEGLWCCVVPLNQRRNSKDECEVSYVLWRHRGDSASLNGVCSCCECFRLTILVSSHSTTHISVGSIW